MLLVELLGGKRLRGGLWPPGFGELQTAETASYLHSCTYLNEAVHEMGVTTSDGCTCSGVCLARPRQHGIILLPWL